jgi:hypothetical protein
VYALRLPAGLPPWIYGLVIVLMITTVVSTAAVRISRNLSPQDSADRLMAFTRWLAYRRWARSRSKDVFAIRADAARHADRARCVPTLSTSRPCRCRATPQRDRRFRGRRSY